jgi:hypothetical protein
MGRRRIYAIKYCFKFQCPKLWDDLEKTESESIKFCNECQNNVYKATNKGMLSKYAAEGKCVAYFHYEKEMLLGMPRQPENNFIPSIPLKKTK